MTGVEPATSTLARLRSSQLSYTRESRLPSCAVDNGRSAEEQLPTIKFCRERREWDSNPRYPFGVHTISSRARSTTPAPLRIILPPCGPRRSPSRPAAVLRWASSARRSRTSSGSCSPPSSAFGPRGTPGIHAGTYRFRSSVALRCWGAGHDERRERRGWDSNPRCLFRAHTISSRAPSTGLGHLSRSRSCNPRQCASQPEMLRRTSDGTLCRFHPRVAGDARPDVNRGVAACRPPRTAGAAPRRTRAAAARSRRPRRPP